MIKPQKAVFGNPSILYALGEANKGKIRETFFASMVGWTHELGYLRQGDFLVDNRYIFEVGGLRKGFEQIRDLPDSFIAADGIDYGLALPTGGSRRSMRTTVVRSRLRAIASSKWVI